MHSRMALEDSEIEPCAVIIYQSDETSNELSLNYSSALGHSIL